ncbi:hypothetical protein LSCM1_05948 [Leishmania martiniquensis]|uniref:Uncharacterized protein n=1 Tax=Leishmania martiniquensis TaxID=1580590 RepID=A0A836HX13_9TRYP|nr:hypothetical protein LSCM1_05948 [Leishmania martiniquensis]
MQRCALFTSDSDDNSNDDDAGVFSLAAARAGDRAVSGASGSRLAEDSPAASAASQLYSSSVKRDRNSTEVMQLPEPSIVTATRRNLSQLFGADPARLKMPGAASSQLPPSTTPTTVAVNASNGVAFEAGDASAEAATFFAPRFDYDSSGGRCMASGAAAGVAAASGEAAAGLITAEHAVVQAYRGSLCSGTCMLALCVPPASPSETASSASSPPSVAVRRHLQHEKQGAGAGSNAAAGCPVLMLISINRQVLCRIALDATDAVFAGASLQLRQDAAQPQYLTFFDDGRVGIRGGNSSQRSAGGGGSSGCWWTCMFPDRDKASRFLVSAYTIAQYSAALAKRVGTTPVPIPSVRTLPTPPPSKTEKAVAELVGGAPGVVRADVPALMCWQTWELRRISRQTLYCVPGRCIEAVPPSAPQAVSATDGSLWAAAADALVGMREGESRLVFLTPENTGTHLPRSQIAPRLSDRPSSRAPQRALDTPAVIYMTCLQVASSPIGTPAPSTETAAGDLAPTRPLPPAPAPATADPAPSPAAEPSKVPPAADALSTNALLQQLLLHLLQQQQQQQSPSASASHQAASQQSWESVERALASVQVQLGSLYEKIDRLDIEAKLQRNNTELERVMRRVVGLAPQEEVAIEDALKDREALLASIERYRHKYEEANENYQRALEAMSRSSDRAQALERDLHLQQDLWTRQRKDEAEQTRLRLVERDARHRDELERVSEERYAAGRLDGHAAGYREGRQATLLEVEGSCTGGAGGSVVAEWQAKLMAKEQEVTALQVALQDAKFRHERDRRQLRAEIDVLSELNEKLQHLQANADVRVPEETVQQQCKRVKRMLNAVYSQVEGKLLQLSSLQSHPRSKGPPSLTADKGGSVEKPCEELGSDGDDATAVAAVDDVLAIITEAIRSEAQAAVLQIRSNEAQRAAENVQLRELIEARRGRQQQTPALNPEYLSSTSPAPLAGTGAPLEIPTPEAEQNSAAARALATPPPPLPPVHTAASQDELAAVAAALLPEVAQAALVMTGAAEAAGDAAEDAFRGDRRACEGTAVTRVTALSAAAEESFYSEVGAKGSGGANGNAAWASCPPCSAPADGVLNATAASSLPSASANERGADFSDLGAGSLLRAVSSRPVTARTPQGQFLAEAGDSEALCSYAGDSTADASHAFQSSVIATADAAAASADATAARASAAPSSSSGAAEKVQTVPAPSTVLATTATDASAPTWTGVGNQFVAPHTHTGVEMVRPVDIESALTPRHSTSSLSSSSSAPAKPSRMATRLSTDALASPPPPPALPNAASLIDAAAEHATTISDA